jgi:hypothetical protein
MLNVTNIPNMVSVIMLNVTNIPNMVSVIMLNVNMLTVLAPYSLLLTSEKHLWFSLKSANYNSNSFYTIFNKFIIHNSFLLNVIQFPHWEFLLIKTIVSGEESRNK